MQILQQKLKLETHLFMVWGKESNLLAVILLVTLQIECCHQMKETIIIKNLEQIFLPEILQFILLTDQQSI